MRVRVEARCEHLDLIAVRQLEHRKTIRFHLGAQAKASEEAHELVISLGANADPRHGENPHLRLAAYRTYDTASFH